MKSLFIACTAGLITVFIALFLASGSRAASPAHASYEGAPVQPPANFTLGPAHSTAHTSRAQAIQVAANEFGPGMLNNTMTVDYGSFTDNSHSQAVNGRSKVIGTIDAWKITFTGFTEPRPCPQLNLTATQMASACPPIHNLSVIVDDTTGNYVEAVGW